MRPDDMTFWSAGGGPTEDPLGDEAPWTEADETDLARPGEGEARAAARADGSPYAALRRIAAPALRDLEDDELAGQIEALCGAPAPDLERSARRAGVMGGAAPSLPLGPVPVPVPVRSQGAERLLDARRRAARQAPPERSARAARAVMRLLSRPETAEALMAACLGKAGRGTVRVGRLRVPSSAIVGAIGLAAAPPPGSEEEEEALEALSLLGEAPAGEGADAADGAARRAGP